MSMLNIYVEIPGIEGEIELFGDVEVVDNGIGPYEYWGQKCVDHCYEPEVQEITWENDKCTEEENVIIQKYVDDNYDSLCNDLIQNYEPEIYEPPEME
jgi:hypothetical protein